MLKYLIIGLLLARCSGPVAPGETSFPIEKFSVYYKDVGGTQKKAVFRDCERIADDVLSEIKYNCQDKMEPLILPGELK